ncbi:MAG: Nramp family divalent metal transporter [Halobacteriovoraceae bacterium]|nr:Nramp family divalent metal transporter [Halobacteriovoraceae bacterium]MCB9093614.1 Nramp family divalent metal transporter [Halobacteriovoraceae bacterium]
MDHHEHDKSLYEMHGSVEVKKDVSFFKRFFRFSGPAFMVAVGYMDPGNWATDIAGGSEFGYQLIWVILLSNILAILFQTLSARLGIVTGRDIAQACRDHYTKRVNLTLWIICEIAIVATDLAEVLGSAIGLYLLFDLPILAGVVVTALDVMILLALERFGVRKMEALILTLVATIGICFGIEIFLSKPDLIELSKGFIPSKLSPGALYISLGIIGATLMPHNLYLHSALVQTRKIGKDLRSLKEATRFNFIDSVFALNGAFFVNAAILVLAAATFYTAGHTQVSSIIDAHKMLEPLLGTSVAPMAFAIALLASGQSSTITGTYAGQIVMEGFIGWRIRPWLRRIITRLLAIVPAVVLLLVMGNSAVDSLLVLSQVVLSLQLPFALIPLLHFTNDKLKMKEFASPLWLKIFGWLAATLIIVLNLKLVYDFIFDSWSEPGSLGVATQFILMPTSIGLVLLLLWVVIEPFVKKATPIEKPQISTPDVVIPDFGSESEIKKIGIALEVHEIDHDKQILEGAFHFLRQIKPEIVLIHITESAAGYLLKADAHDEEIKFDTAYMEKIAMKFQGLGIQCKIRIGTGRPAKGIVDISHQENLDMLVLGMHGHKLLEDILRGTTIPEVRHNAGIPIFTIPIS